MGLARSIGPALSAVLLVTSVAPVVAQTQVEAPQCVGDANGDGHVTSEELVQSVNNALADCGQVPVVLRFRGQVGSQEFACGTTYEGVGSSQLPWAPSDFRLYVSDVRLRRDDGTEVRVTLDQDIWQLGDTVLLDFENGQRPCNNGTPQTNTTVRGRVPAGDYTGVHFTLGVPFALNHADASAAASPLNLTAMFWGWQAGYKFLRVDSFAVSGDEFVEFRIHLGSTGCRFGRPLEVAGCVWPNRADVRLDDFDAASDVIVADLGAVLAESDLASNAAGTPPGCMSDPEDADCDAVLRRLGVDFDDGYPSPATQAFFRVETANP
jgi:uncharacterized repeat protein (TIGR04052 family)